MAQFRGMGVLVAIPLATTPALGLDESALLETAGRMHPALVHFPIALILTAFFFEIVRVLARGRRPSPAALGCLVLALLGAGASIATGWLHADIEGLAGDTGVELHRWVAIAAGSCALIALLFGMVARTGNQDSEDPRHASRRLYMLFLVVAAGCVGFAGHQGGELVYGEGYMFEPIFGSPVSTDDDAANYTPPTSPVPEQVDFNRDLLPVFTARCIKCHGPKKQNGKLRLDSLEALKASRYFDEVVVAGNPDESTLAQRIVLDPEDRDFMPKRGKPLGKWEVEAIRRWITQQAPGSNGQTGDSSAESLSIDDLIDDVLDTPPAELSRVIAQVKERGGFAAIESAGSDRLVVNWSVLSRPITPDDLELLAPVADSVVDLNLSGVGLTDALLKPVASMSNIERLNISRADLSDRAIEGLEPLGSLRVLNLYGTPVTNGCVESIAALPNLERVYIWRTFIDEQGISKLAQARPDLVVISGETEPNAADKQDLDPDRPDGGSSSESGVENQGG